MSNAAVNIGVQTSEFLLSILLGIFWEVELLGHTVILSLIFEDLPTFSIVATPFYIPTSNASEFQFIHIFFFKYIIAILMGVYLTVLSVFT